VVDQLTGIKGFVAASTPLPTKTMIRRQMLPLSHTLEGNRQIVNF
jgi:hypothetical protein